MHPDSHTNPTCDANSLDVNPVGVVGSLLHAARLIRSELTNCYDDIGLNESRFLLLIAVRRLEADGCTQTRLAQALNQSESNICTLVERMRSDGLVYRQRLKSDRRKKFLMLTDLGRKKLEKSESAYSTCCGLMLRRMDIQQRQQLAESLAQFVECWKQSQTSAGETNRSCATIVPHPHILPNGKTTRRTEHAVRELSNE